MIHARNIVHETLEGETIVIHLDTGSYYTLTGSGAEIWELLGDGRSTAEICAVLGQRYATRESEISREVESFINDLERESLVEEGEAPLDGPPAAVAGAAGPWAPPKLERFEDMRDFLLVDPIHEVDDAGWPRRKSA